MIRNKKCIEGTLSFFISLICFAFVSWQSGKCISKYLQDPQATKLSLQNSANHQQFPSITICKEGKADEEYGSDKVEDRTPFDFNFLKACGISNFGDYKFGKWTGTGENCSNPRLFYESIVAKPKEVFQYIIYSYFEKNTTTIDSAANISSKIRTIVDTKDHGRCFTFKPTAEMISYGISQVQLRVFKPMRMFFHTNGLFKTAEVEAQITIGTSRIYHVQLDHEVYKMLDLGGHQCSQKPNFDKDNCTEAKFERLSLEKFGCTSPFGPNKDKICPDKENGTKIMELYTETFNKYTAKHCENPCSFVLTKATITKDITHYDTTKVYNYTTVTIYFKEHIKVIEAHYLYSGLSLIAEIGGYVGLFLGISVNQVSVLFNAFLDRIDGSLNSK